MLRNDNGPGGAITPPGPASTHKGGTGVEKPTCVRVPATSFEDAMDAYDLAWVGIDAANAELILCVRDLIDTTRRRALDDVGIDQVEDELRLLDLLADGTS